MERTTEEVRELDRMYRTRDDRRTAEGQAALAAQVLRAAGYLFSPESRERRHRLESDLDALAHDTASEAEQLDIAIKADHDAHRPATYNEG